jgi:hypothetical protein
LYTPLRHGGKQGDNYKRYADLLAKIQKQMTKNMTVFAFQINQNYLNC